MRSTLCQRRRLTLSSPRIHEGWLRHFLRFHRFFRIPWNRTKSGRWNDLPGQFAKTMGRRYVRQFKRAVVTTSATPPRYHSNKNVANDSHARGTRCFPRRVNRDPRFALIQRHSRAGLARRLPVGALSVCSTAASSNADRLYWQRSCQLRHRALTLMPVPIVLAGLKPKVKSSIPGRNGTVCGCTVYANSCTRY